jgi:arylsulfatase A-like enzyme
MGDVPGLIDGVAFTNAVSTANATGSSMPSLVGGIYSETVHAATRTLKFGESSAEDGFTTMAEALSAIGYDCRLWSSNHIVGSKRHYDRGFADGNAGEPSYKKFAQRFLDGRTIEHPTDRVAVVDLFADRPPIDRRAVGVLLDAEGRPRYWEHALEQRRMALEGSIRSGRKRMPGRAGH